MQGTSKCCEWCIRSRAALQEPTAATATHLNDVKSNGDSGLTFNALMDRAKAAPADAHAYMDSGEVRLP